MSKSRIVREIEELQRDADECHLAGFRTIATVNYDRLKELQSKLKNLDAVEPLAQED